MKVMIASSLYWPNIVGGAEKSIQVIADNMKNYGVDPLVVTISDKDDIDYVNGVKVYYVSHCSIYWSYHSKTKNIIAKIFWHLISLYNPGILRKIDRILNIEKPDVIHTNNLAEFTVGLWKLAKKRKIPLLHTLRDFSLICPRATLYKRRKVCRRRNPLCYLMMRFRRSFSNLPDAVAGNSRFVLEKHIETGFFKNSRKYVVYNSLESEVIKPNKNIEGRMNFGYVGQLSYHKGIEFLLELFKRNNLAELQVFGRGVTSEYEEYLIEKYSSERIKFNGFVETGRAFSFIDVLIVPSLCLDALPRVIYEAYSHGIPVISSDRGGGKEIVDTGKTGFVYSAESKENILKEIRKFIDEPGLASRMREACLKKAEDFLPQKSVRSYADIYKDII